LRETRGLHLTTTAVVQVIKAVGRSL